MQRRPLNQQGEPDVQTDSHAFAHLGWRPALLWLFAVQFPFTHKQPLTRRGGVQTCTLMLAVLYQDAMEMRLPPGSNS